MKIKTAGAGAGKTTNLVDDILVANKNKKNGKHIFVLAYSNYARKIITQKLIEIMGELPSDIHVTTIHSFFYNQIIDPYYYLLYDKQFNEISNQKLPSKPEFKSAILKSLRDSGIIHVEEFSRFAKLVVKGKSGDLKHVKEVRSNINEKITGYLSCIFIDEAQDMNRETSEVFSKLDEFGIDVNLIGDVNQDLHNRKAFSSLVDENKDCVTFIPENYRCPASHILLSNHYISENQLSKSGKNGELLYCLESKIDVPNFIKSKNFDLTFVKQSKGIFQVHESKQGSSASLMNILKRYLLDKYPSVNTKDDKFNKFIFDYARKLSEQFDSGIDERKLTSSTIRELGLKYSSKLYASLCDGIKQASNKLIKKVYINVQSIEAVKGSEGANCLFILSTDLFPYFIEEKKDHNSMLCLLYVALTRSTDRLTIMITKELEEAYGENAINEYMHTLGISPVVAS